MKTHLLSLLLLLATMFGNAQNLVLNPSFESYITCPAFGQFSPAYISNWSKPSIASSDYYHFTCPGINPSLQWPRSGEGYAGIIGYNFGQEYREYITGTLASPLVAGQTYTVEFYVSLHNGYIQAIEELGAYLSPVAPGPFSNVLHIAVTPQIENISAALNDTVNWRRVWGTMVANGGEQYITIGNFRSDSATTITQPGSSGSFGAYYFIDDVSVTLDSTTSLQQLNTSVSLSVWIESNQMMVDVQNISAEQFPLSLTLLNALGQTIKSTTLFHSLGAIYLYDFSGVAFVQVRNNRGLLAGKKILVQ